MLYVSIASRFRRKLNFLLLLMIIFYVKGPIQLFNLHVKIWVVASGGDSVLLVVSCVDFSHRFTSIYVSKHKVSFVEGISLSFQLNILNLIADGF